VVYLALVRDFCSLPLSERRFIAESFGVTRADPMEPDLEIVKRTVKAVVDQNKRDEFAELVAAAKRK
jgi:hypothetical protein